MDWQTRIRALLDAGLSLDEVAVAMGVTGNAVREVLAGRTRAPRAEAAMALLALYDKQFPGKRAA